MNKEEGESTLQFVTRLRQQAEHCVFGDLVEQQIRDYAIENTTDRRLKAKLLEKGDLTLTQLLAIARVHEALCLRYRRWTSILNKVEMDLWVLFVENNTKDDDKMMQ
ncbi:hypothetical protein V1264_000468 [Littorina saxatilis]|uniref:Uncharacterized protein n=1 Tax=Littorina saxatilis TaxID=31220 RepID=A0AAN9BZX2_9CAEN